MRRGLARESFAGTPHYMVNRRAARMRSPIRLFSLGQVILRHVLRVRPPFRAEQALAFEPDLSTTLIARVDQ